MVKQQGSLGFTLRKEDESVLGHYVRALVREPATTDGRIRPGDKIVAVSCVGTRVLPRPLNSGILMAGGRAGGVVMAQGIAHKKFVQQRKNALKT